ncbi:MAG: rod shape-determining protein RodA [Flavobacteriales bacterium]|nr:rod shape-determining protein RodA [Flavobacteriales bacterium]
MTDRSLKREARIDWLPVFLYLFIVVFGWFNVFAATRPDTDDFIFSMSTNYGRQAMWIGFSLVAALVIMLFDSKFFPAFAYPIYITGILLLAAVLVVGQEVAGSKSWFVITEAIKFQPSEFAKFATALGLAKYMGEKNFSFLSTSRYNRIETANPKSWVFLPLRLIGITSMEGAFALILFLVPAALILLENDTGSTMAFAALFLVFYREGVTGIILVAGIVMAALFLLNVVVDEIYLIIPVSAIGLLGALYLFFRRNIKPGLIVVILTAITVGFIFMSNYILDNLKPHQKTRVEVLMGVKKDLKGAGYNVNQSKIAIGSGGLAGKGFLNGTQTKYRFVPKQYTDFIFSAVGEEWGFLGAGLLIAAYVLLLCRIILRAEKQRSRFSRIYGYSVASILFAHFALNVGMAIGIMPTIGIPLPMVSYGGSSLFSFTILLFVFIKLDSNRNEILW